MYKLIITYRYSIVYDKYKTSTIYLNANGCPIYRRIVISFRQF